MPAPDPNIFTLDTAMTGKDDTMEWKQIETKWAAMTRRIRADYATDRIATSCGPVRDLPRRDAVPSTTIAESRTALAKHPEFKTSSK